MTRGAAEDPLGEPSLGIEFAAMCALVEIVAAASKRLATDQKCKHMLEPQLNPRFLAALITEKTRRGLHLRFEGDGATWTEDDPPKKIGEVDIKVMFAHSWRDEDSYLGLECKRLGQAPRLRRLFGRYVSEGVMRFVTGKYSRGHRWGMMVGYVIDGCVSAAARRLRATICRARVRAAMVEGLAPARDIAPIRHLYGTWHKQRKTNIPIRLLHYLFPLP